MSSSDQSLVELNSELKDVSERLLKLTEGSTSGSTAASPPKREKIAQMSAEVVDSNPYSRLMALKRMGIVENYEQIREKTVAVVGVGGDADSSTSDDDETRQSRFGGEEREVYHPDVPLFADYPPEEESLANGEEKLKEEERLPSDDDNQRQDGIDIIDLEEEELEGCSKNADLLSEIELKANNTSDPTERDSSPQPCSSRMASIATPVDKPARAPKRPMNRAWNQQGTVAPLVEDMTPYFTDEDLPHREVMVAMNNILVQIRLGDPGRLLERINDLHRLLAKSEDLIIESTYLEFANSFSVYAENILRILRDFEASSGSRPTDEERQPIAVHEMIASVRNGLRPQAAANQRDREPSPDIVEIPVEPKIQNPLMCKRCNEQCKSIHHLDSHMRVKHKTSLKGESMKPLAPRFLRCYGCSGIIFKDAESMRAHMTEKPHQTFVCPICTSQHAQLPSLTRHIKMKHSSIF